MSDTKSNSPSGPDSGQAQSQGSGSGPSTGVQQAMSDPSARRALLLQALLARQQPTGRGASGSPLGGSLGSIASPGSPASGGSPTIPLPEVPLAPGLSQRLDSAQPATPRGDSIPLGLSLGEGALSEALMTGNWDQVVQGLDAVADEGGDHNRPAGAVGGGVSSEQLDVAQKALEAWANTHKPSPVYQAHNPSPIQHHPHPPPSHYVTSSPPSSTQSPAPFPWAALYPHSTTSAPPLGSAYHTLPLPHTTGPPGPPLNSGPYYNTSDPPTRSHSFSEELPTIIPQIDSATTSAKKKGGAKKGAGKKALASGATGAAAEAAERAAEEESARVAQANMTPEEIEEDKRRRNTEASARFRAKKKQRDAELNQTTSQLRQRVSDLEAETASLKTENRWLRELISEKTGRDLDPRLLELLRATQASRMGDE